MTKNKIMRYFKKAVASTLAIATSFSGVVSANMVTTFAADAELDNGVKITAKKHIYDDTMSYISKNANKKMSSLRTSQSVSSIKKDLKETKYEIRVKQLIAEKSKIPTDCTIDELWAKHSDAFVSQYTTFASLYETNDDADYYIANLASTKINQTGKIYDAAFIKGLDNSKPDVLKDIKFDKSSGLAYIPKSYFEKDKDVLITAQTMSAGTVDNQTISIDTTVDNGGDITKQAVEANTYDVTIKVPITTSKRVADQLKLSDFEVYLNGSDAKMELTKDTAVFDKTHGVLEIAASPATLTSINVKIKKIGITKSVARLLTRTVNASVSNASSLKYVTDKASGDPILLDKIDADKLQDGQVFEYRGSTHYENKEEISAIYAGTWKDNNGNKATKNYQAKAESVMHSRKFLYVPSGIDSDSAWFKIYDDGSSYNGSVKKVDTYDYVTFYMALPATDGTEVTAKNKNKATLNFHQKGSFTTKFTPENYPKDTISYTAQHMYGGDCAHITNPLGGIGDQSQGKTRLSILHVDKKEGYVIIGLNCAKTNIQSGFGIYKLKINVDHSGYVQVKKTSANSAMTKGSGCYSFKGATFGLYSDKACTKKITTLTADENGNTKSFKIDDVGTNGTTYYVKGARRFLINA